MDNEQDIDRPSDEAIAKFMEAIEPIMDSHVKEGGITLLIVVDHQGFQIRSNLNRDGQAQLLIDTLKAVVEGEGDAEAT